MSEQDRLDKRTAPQAQQTPPLRYPRSSVDELKVYGDSEEDSAPRPRRGEKAPSRESGGKKKKPLRRKHRKGYYLALLSRIWSRNEKGIRIFGRRLTLPTVILVTLAVVLVSVIFLENRNLSVDDQTVTIVGLDSELEGYRILQLSDLNGRRFGDKQSTLLRAIDTLSYDAVFFTGDMVGPKGDPQPFYELLEGLPTRKKVFFIAGDSDPGPYVEAARGDSGLTTELVLADWILGAIERGAVYVDSPMEVKAGATTYWISPASLLNVNAVDSASLWKDQMEQEQAGVVNGIQADYHSLPFTSYRYEVAQKTQEAVEVMDDTALHISLSHVPPTADFVRAAYSHDETQGKYLTQPDLILAGHYCGGVWRLPLIGAFYIPNSAAPRYGWFPAQSSVSGLSSVGETQVYITRGLSTCSDAPAMGFRLFNRPQITLLTLTATLPSILEK